MKLFLYFSQIMGMDILDDKGEFVGALHDLVMNPAGELYPKSTGLVLVQGQVRRRYAHVKWEDVAYIEQEIRLKISMPAEVFSNQIPKCDFTLRRDILDQQVVDTDDQRVVRVNDIHLLRVENQLYAAHVDVGLRGLVRRLEWTAVVDFAVRLFDRKSPYLTQEEFIPWKNTQVLPKLGRMKSVLKLDVSRNKLQAIPPAALADIIQDLDAYARVSLFRSLDAALQNKVFTDMNLSFKTELIDQLDEAEVANLLTNIPADEATDLLMKLPRPQTAHLMGQLGSETNKKLRKLLSYAKDTAGGLMTTEFLWLKQDATAADGLRKIKENTSLPGSIFFLYLVDDQNRLVASTSLRRFINADPSVKLVDVSYEENIYVYTHATIEEVAILLERHKFSSIAVVNDDQVLQGVITIDDVMEELIALVWSKYKEKL